MRPLASRTPGSSASRLFLVLLLPLAAAMLAAPSSAQIAIQRVAVGPIERLTLLRSGTFEAWQDTTRLGTETYAVYMTPARDSVISTSDVHYEIRSHANVRAYTKWAFGVTETVDDYPLIYQCTEEIGTRNRATRVSTHDTTAVIYHEDGGKGTADAISVPPGRLYILDPSVYQLLETLVARFHQEGLATRTQNVIMVPRDTIVAVRLTRGPQETIELSGRGKVQATRVDVNDDLTLVQTWLDGDGRLLQVLAPAHGVRIVRLPPGKEEQDIIHEAHGGGKS